MRLKEIGIYLIWVMLLFSCRGNDVEPMAEDGETDMKIAISSRGAVSDENLLNEGEWVIKRLRIYAFDGTVLDCQKYIGDISSDNKGYYETVMKVKSNTNKNVVVVVNESDAMVTELNAVSSLSDLNSIKFNLADYTTGAYISDSRPAGFNLPMYGTVSAINATANTSVNVSVQVKRAVARVDLYFKSDVNTLSFKEGMKIIANNIPTSGYISPNSIVSTEYGDKTQYIMSATETYNVPITSVAADATHFCSFYTPERNCIYDNFKMQIKLSGLTSTFGATNFLVNYQFILDYINTTSGTEEILVLSRNNIYKVVCTFLEKDYPIEFSVSLYDWTSESHDIIM